MTWLASPEAKPRRSPIRYLSSGSIYKRYLHAEHPFWHLTRISCFMAEWGSSSLRLFRRAIVELLLTMGHLSA